MVDKSHHVIILYCIIFSRLNYRSHYYSMLYLCASLLTYSTSMSEHSLRSCPYSFLSYIFRCVLIVITRKHFVISTPALLAIHTPGLESPIDSLYVKLLHCVHTSFPNLKRIFHFGVPFSAVVVEMYQAMILKRSRGCITSIALIRFQL